MIVVSKVDARTLLPHISADTARRLAAVHTVTRDVPSDVLQLIITDLENTHKYLTECWNAPGSNITETLRGGVIERRRECGSLLRKMQKKLSQYNAAHAKESQHADAHDADS